MDLSDEPISIHSSHTGRDVFHNDNSLSGPFQSTLPIREETAGTAEGGKRINISIHSSHTGRDNYNAKRLDKSDNFNPLFPYGKRRDEPEEGGDGDGFQSTLPIREETDRGQDEGRGAEISIHSSHTGRDGIGIGVGVLHDISIHSSHTGRDSLTPSTPETDAISIHSSHTGRDTCPPLRRRIVSHFNPLFPYGKRRRAGTSPASTKPFQSTLPIREETITLEIEAPYPLISIHSSHTGRDSLPRPAAPAAAEISIHSSHTGRDSARRITRRALSISIHSSHTGRDFA